MQCLANLQSQKTVAAMQHVRDALTKVINQLWGHPDLYLSVCIQHWGSIPCIQNLLCPLVCAQHTVYVCCRSFKMTRLIIKRISAASRRNSKQQFHSVTAWLKSLLPGNLQALSAVRGLLVFPTPLAGIALCLLIFSAFYAGTQLCQPVKRRVCI